MPLETLLTDAHAAMCTIVFARRTADPTRLTRLRRRVYAAVRGDADADARSLGAVVERSDRRDDAALLRGLQVHDASALHTVAARYGEQLLGYAAKHLRGYSDAAAETVVGDALLALWSKADMLTADSNLKAFLFKVVREAVIDVYRRQGAQPEIVESDGGDPQDDGPDPLAQLHARADLQDTIVALEAHCNPLEQDVLLLTARGMSDGEIAEKLEIRRDWVRQNRRRGRKKLRSALNRD